MGALFTKYYRLQEVNRELEADTKVKVVKELLEVLDDLERAQDQSGGFARVAADKFQAKLQALGFQRIEAVGSQFDPNVHEAAVQREVTGRAAGEVCEELRSGWLL